MPFISANKVEISFDDQGSGEPALLFLPGWCGSSAVFNHLAEQCAKHRRVLAVDWRGHGRSGPNIGDFGAADLVNDALAVIKASQAAQVVPVALSHAGWVAIELRRKLELRIPKLVLLDWIVLEAPPPFLGAMQSLQDPAQWQQAREQLFSIWLRGLEIPELTRYVHEDMGTYPFEMWARAGREISVAYAKEGSPLQALAGMSPSVEVLHMYAQPEDPAYLAAQLSFAAAHPWFHVSQLKARSHFPMLEVPDEMAALIEQFVA